MRATILSTLSTLAVAFGLAALVFTTGACGGSGGGGGGGPPAPTADVALLYSFLSGGSTEGNANDVVAKVQASGRFQSVSLLNVSPGYPTPSLSILQAFEALLVVSDATFDDPTALGDVLADYVDAGGGVVLAMSSFNTGTSGVHGRFQSGGYFAIPADSSTNSFNGTYGLGTVHLPAHPVMAGVTSFIGGPLSARPNTMAIAAGATRVADWNDGGTPLVVVREINGVRRVDLGFKPASGDRSANYWDTSTDGAVLLNNALAWVTGP